jgi:hypothetical protein
MMIKLGAVVLRADSRLDSIRERTGPLAAAHDFKRQPTGFKNLVAFTLSPWGVARRGISL